MSLWEYSLGFETFCLCFFKCIGSIAQRVLIFLGKEMIVPPSTELLLQARQSKAEKNHPVTGSQPLDGD